MPERIAKATALDIPFRAYLSDGVTLATSKTIAITISKNHAGFGNPNAGATNATEISSGWYYVTLDTTDTGTVGILLIRGAATGVEDVGLAYRVVNATNGGYTALPDAVADAAGGLPISDAGGLDMDSIKSELVKVPKSDSNVTWNATALASINAEVDTAFTTAIADSYAAHEAQPTRDQALLGTLQFLTEKSVTSTTVTVSKPDGTTAVQEFTLNSATAPTSITRKANP